jgi:acetyl esterase/lipase
MKHVIYVLIMMLMCITVKSQNKIKLWEHNPPVDNGIVVSDKNVSGNKDNIPELEIFLPDKSKATGMAVIVCPGGSYWGLAYEHEGTMVAKWLNNEGIAAFILEYRMPNKHKTVPLDDAWQAIRLIRENADKYGINPSKIGICGFSAGGHLASTASTHFTTSGTSVRPDFSILFYPVITMEESFTHHGSRNNLLGDNPSAEDILLYSNEKQVSKQTPPTILLLSDDDKVVVPENSIKYYEALKKNEIPATMYIFPKGEHGWGFRDTFEYYKPMTELLSKWLKSINK